MGETPTRGANAGRKRRVLLAGTLSGVLALVVAGVAWATFQPTVLYSPPLLKLLDHPSHNSQEQITVRRDGADFVLTNPVSPPAMDPASAPGCEEAGTSVSCPREKVTKLVILLGAMSDTADVDLGRSADKVRQIVKGQGDEDSLTGGRGSQKLMGGDDGDGLYGGPGPDILIGGDGNDTCDGGPGQDEFISCEAAPVR